MNVRLHKFGFIFFDLCPFRRLQQTYICSWCVVQMHLKVLVRFVEQTTPMMNYDTSSPRLRPKPVTRECFITGKFKLFESKCEIVGVN